MQQKQRNQEQHRPGQIGQYWVSEDGKSPYWQRTWYDEQSRQTRRASLGTRDFFEATEILADWFVNHRRLRDEHPSEVTLANILARDYQEYASSLASADTFRHSFKRWVNHFGEAMVSEIDRGTVNGFVEAMQSEDLSVSYINRVICQGRSENVG